MKAAIYCRVSSEDQEREGSSLHTQLEACLSYCRDKGYDIGYRFSEAFSGLTLERPKLNEVRELVRTRAMDVVVVYCLDRLSRDPTHGVILTQEFEKYGIVLDAVTEDVDNSELGKLISYIRGFAAKLEAEKIKERTSRGRKARIAAGKLANGKANNLFGYEYIPGRGDGEGVRKVNLEQAKVVRDIYNWFVSENLPLDRVVYRLKDLGIASPTGNAIWARATVYKMLTNSAYCGLQGEATPAIVYEETFIKVKARLKRNKELASRNTKRDYLLRGYVFCKYCGRRYQGALKQYNTKEGVQEYKYYRCSSSFRINANLCPNHSWRAERLENIVWQEVKSVLANPDVIMNGLEAIQEDTEQVNSYADEFKAVETRLIDLDKDQQQLLQWALKGFPEATIARENNRINDDRKRLNERKAELKAKIESAKNAKVDKSSIVEACSLVKQKLQVLSSDDKRLALEALDIRVSLGDSSILLEGAIPLSNGAVESTSAN